MSCKKYITETKIYVEGGQVDSFCNSLLFINTGADVVNVDGLNLQPNQSWTIDGNFDELNIKTYPFRFLTTTNPSLTAIFKRYV
jgi:hypothetical protein